eukprot:3742122-Rhodomonas_salina.1
MCNLLSLAGCVGGCGQAARISCPGEAVVEGRKIGKCNIIVDERVVERLLEGGADRRLLAKYAPRTARGVVSALAGFGCEELGRAFMQGLVRGGRRSVGYRLVGWRGDGRLEAGTAEVGAWRRYSCGGREAGREVGRQRNSRQSAIIVARPPPARDVLWFDFVGRAGTRSG